MLAVPSPPDTSAINAHLYRLFPADFVHLYPDAVVEVAYRHPAARNFAAQTFSAFKLEEAADLAQRMNAKGCNVYIGPALRRAGAHGRAKKNDVLASLYGWCDFDGADDLDRVTALLQDHEIQPSLIVITGLTPHPRFQMYFRLKEPATLEQMEAVNAALRSWLGGDDVQNGDRIMRLGGTVNYPPPDKTSRGYVNEPTVFEERQAGPYALQDLLTVQAVQTTVQTVQTASGNGHSPDNPFIAYAESITPRKGRSLKELQTMLEAGRIGHWHNNMRSVIASLVGKGWHEDDIRSFVGPYCDHGEVDPDLDPLIGGGVKKGWGEERRNAEAFPELEPPPANNQQEAPPDRSDLTVDAWLVRELPPRDHLVEGLLCTTSRWMISGDTGIGKTLFALELAFAVSHGNCRFLNWDCSRPCRVLYLDGEMPAETVKDRVKAAADIYGGSSTMFIYSRDVLSEKAMPPLNTPEGQKWLLAEIEIVRPDLIVFDSMFCLLNGLLADEETWIPVKPLVRWLSSQRIAQIWLNHTGHDGSRSYGSKNKQWEMDSALMLTRPPDVPGGDGQDIQLEFAKARLRTPRNFALYKPQLIRRSEEGWKGEVTTVSGRGGNKGELKRRWFREAYFDLAPSQPTESGHNHMPVRKVPISFIQGRMIAHGHLEKTESGALSSGEKMAFKRAKESLLASGDFASDGVSIWSTK